MTDGTQNRYAGIDAVYLLWYLRARRGSCPVAADDFGGGDQTLYGRPISNGTPNSPASFSRPSQTFTCTGTPFLRCAKVCSCSISPATKIRSRPGALAEFLKPRGAVGL